MALNATWQGNSVSAGVVMTDTAQVLSGVPGSPFDGLAFDVSEDGRTLTLDIDREKLEVAPSFDRDIWPNLEDVAWRQTVEAFYESLQ